MTHPLKTYRTARHLTLEAFAEMIGVTKSIVSRWEAGKVLPRAETMRAIERLTCGEVKASEIVDAYSSIPEAAE
jgi:transcriptional regulator with XRE-family HTH domain